jgi:hypothetical protein
MLQQTDPSPHLRQWLDRLAPLVEKAQAELSRRDPDMLTRCGGCRRDADGNLHLAMLGKEYLVAIPGFQVRAAGDGKETSSFFSSLILTYLANADGTPPSGTWIGFRDLPDGMFYVQAFQGYSGGRLVRELAGGLEVFRRAAQTLGGRPFGLGSAAYAFDVLPQVRLALVYWEGDEEFPAQAQVLFDAASTRYLPTDGLAILGSQLVGQVIKAAGSRCY